MQRLTYPERADVHLAYGAANGNVLAAQRLYHLRHPGRPVPHRSVFTNVDRLLRETGSFLVSADTLLRGSVSLRLVFLFDDVRIVGQVRQERGREYPVRQELEEEVIARVQANPRTSTRQVASEVGCSQTSVWNIFHDANLHPFKLTKVQDLAPGDPLLRLNYCNWLTARIAENQHFLSFVCSTDEKGFSREGMFNAHNSHYWADENPHAVFVRGYQQKFFVNVWAGIVGDYLLGPYILPARLNAQNYLAFLQHQLPDYLDDLPLETLRNMWWQQDGCPAHWGRIVREHLDEQFPGRWIGRGGPVAWPPRSPDLTPPDFFLWGAMERLVYETPVPSEQDLVARVVMAAETIRQQEGVFARMRASWQVRIQRCIEANGQHFEQNL